MPGITDSIPSLPSGSYSYPEHSVKQLVSDSLFFIDGKTIPIHQLTAEKYFRLSNLTPVEKEKSQVTPSTIYGIRSTVTTSINKTVGIGIPKKLPFNTEWSVLIFLLLPLLALITIRYAGQYFRQFPILLVNFKTADKQHKSNLQNFNKSLRFLAVFATFTAACLISYIVHTYPNNFYSTNSTYLLPLVMGLLVAFIILKKLILAFSGVLTYSKELVSELSYTSRLFWGAWGIVNFLLTIILIVNIPIDTKLVEIIIVTNSSIFFVIYLFRTLQLFLSERISLFFWILYLCTLELLPVLLVLDCLFKSR